MKIIEFRTINDNDICNMPKYSHWSRHYEYPFILDFLKKNLATGSKVHNSSWGFEPPSHTGFKDDLELCYGVENITNSDINPSSYPNTIVYDILESPKQEWVEFFDCVLNVSVIEHLPNDKQGIAFSNLYSQVKPEKYFIVTFDMPGANLNMMENFCEKQITIYPNKISGMGLNVGLLILQK